jgi:hypothetical protein
MHMNVRRLIPMVAAVGLGATASGQITSTQGVTAISGSTKVESEFHSPMVLSLPFPLTDRTQWSSSKWSDESATEQLADYRCDGISIQDLQMRAVPLRNGMLQIQVKGNFDSYKDHDKRVDMEFELLNGDVVAATGHGDRLKAPDGERKAFHFDFTIPAAAVQSAPPTRLQITVRDHED